MQDSFKRRFDIAIIFFLIIILKIMYFIKTEIDSCVQNNWKTSLH